MLKKQIAAFYLLFATGLVPAHAENLIDIFELAIKNDPELAAHKARRELAHARTRESMAPLLPAVRVRSKTNFVSSTITRGPSGITNADDYLGSGKYQSQNQEITLTQKILDISSWREFAVARKKRHESDIRYRIAQQNLLYKIAKRYFALLVARGALDHTRSEKNAIANQLNLTRQKHKLGIVAVTDVHEAKARHDLAIAAEVRADNAYARALEEIQQIIGSTPRQLSGLKAQSPLTPPVPTNINDWINAAQSQNLDLILLRKQIETHQAEERSTRGSRWPRADLTAFYGQYDDANYFGMQSIDSGVTLNLEMDLYAGGKSSAKLDQDRQRAIIRQNELAQREREVRSEAKDAYLSVLAGISHVKALNQAVNSSQKALTAIQAGFEVNTRSSLDVLNAQRDLYRAQRDYAHARYEYVMNTLRLKATVGLLTIDDLEQVNEWLI